MDINGIPGARDMARQSYEETRREVARDSRDRVRGAREELYRLSQVRAERLQAARRSIEEARVEETRETATQRSSDRVEISERGRAIAREGHEADSTEEARAERVAALRGEHRRGSVATPERIERAASRILGGE